MQPSKIDRILARGLDIVFPYLLALTVLAVVGTIARFTWLAIQGFLYGDNFVALMAGMVAAFFAAIGVAWWEADRDERDY